MGCGSFNSKYLCFLHDSLHKRLKAQKLMQICKLVDIGKKGTSVLKPRPLFPGFLTKDYSWADTPKWINPSRSFFGCIASRVESNLSNQRFSSIRGFRKSLIWHIHIRTVLNLRFIRFKVSWKNKRENYFLTFNFIIKNHKIKSNIIKIVKF